jgi:hypothetical protein
MSDQFNDGPNRRDVLKRGAMVGGALVWAVPAVQTIASPAFAAGSVAEDNCMVRICIETTPGVPCTPVCVAGAGADCCAAINQANAIANPVQRIIALLAALSNKCNGGALVNCPAA